MKNNNRSGFKVGFLYGFGLSIGKFFGGLFIAAISWCVFEIKRVLYSKSFDYMVNKGTY